MVGFKILSHDPLVEWLARQVTVIFGQNKNKQVLEIWKRRARKFDPFFDHSNAGPTCNMRSSITGSRYREAMHVCHHILQADNLDAGIWLTTADIITPKDTTYSHKILKNICAAEH